MFNIIQNGENRLDIEFSGKLNAEEKKIALDAIENISKNISHVKLIYDVIDFHIPSLSAIVIKFPRVNSKRWSY